MSNNKFKVAVVGSTGIVGRTVLKVLEEKNFSNCEYTLFSSSKSAGSRLSFLGQNYIICELTETSFDYHFDFAIFCAGGDVSKKFAPIAVSNGCVVIDNSSVFRMNKDVPLVVPEVNPEKIRENVGIIANPNCRKMLNRGQEMKNGDVLQLADDIKLEAVPAYNTTPGRDKFHPKGRDNGYILTLGGTRIYIAGDTEDIPELNQVKDIDIAFLPVNQPYTMTPEQAIRATQIIKPHILYPYHYGDTDINKVKEGLKNEKTTEVRIRALQ